jgi:hypothetical protein
VVSVTETLIFIAILGLLFLQLLGRFLKRMQVSSTEPEQRSAEEPEQRSLPERRPETRVFAQPYPPGLPHVAVQQPVATRAPRRQNLQEPDGKELRTVPSLRAGLVPRDRASLRRAILLMDLLGPPRALERPGTQRNH